MIDAKVARLTRDKSVTKQMEEYPDLFNAISCEIERAASVALDYVFIPEDRLNEFKHPDSQDTIISCLQHMGYCTDIFAQDDYKYKIRIAW